MKTVTIKETRDNLATIIDQVSVTGQQFIITKFGKAKALITPLSESDLTSEDKIIKLRAQKGSWNYRDDIKDATTWSSELRKNTSTRK